MRDAICSLRRKEVAEEATGISESRGGIGQIYDTAGNPITDEAATMLLLQGKGVEVPNAGPGSFYRLFTERLGFKGATELETGSSAGDWCFAVFDSEVWNPVWQVNRYPRCGFTYGMSRFDAYTLDELMRMMADA